MEGRVYVGRLHISTRERDLEKFFRGYGKIRSILLRNGYGFVEFEDPRDADDAVYDLNGKSLCGERDDIKDVDFPHQLYIHSVEHSRNPNATRNDMRSGGYGRGGRGGRGNMNDRIMPPLRTEYRVVVENMSSRTSWQDLKAHLGKVAEVTFADCNKGRNGEGVVEFATLGDMKNAITKMNGSELNGRKIRLFEDRDNKSKKSRSGSSRSRSGSRHRRRSPSPRRDSRSPRRRDSRSPKRSRKSRSPRRDSRSRRKDSRSPRRDSRSPARGGSRDSRTSRDGDRKRSHDSRGRDESRSPSAKRSRSGSEDK